MGLGGYINRSYRSYRSSSFVALCCARDAADSTYELVRSERSVLAWPAMRPTGVFFACCSLRAAARLVTHHRAARQVVYEKRSRETSCLAWSGRGGAGAVAPSAPSPFLTAWARAASAAATHLSIWRKSVWKRPLHARLATQVHACSRICIKFLSS